MNARKRNRGNRIEIALNNHVTLRVRQDYPLDEKDITKLNESYNRALLYLDTARFEVQTLQKKLQKLKASSSIPQAFLRNHQHMFDMLIAHFKIDTNDSVRCLTQYLDDIADKLNAMRYGLYADNDVLQLSHISRKNEAKYQSFFGCLLDGYVRPDRGRIYLNLNHLHYSDPDSDKMCRNLIHECSHRFLDTLDFNNAYYDELDAKPATDKISRFLTWYYQDDSYKKLNQLTREMRLCHADSITNFVAAVAKHALQFEAPAKKNTTYPDRELIKTDVCRLFSGKKPVPKAEEVLNTVTTVINAASCATIAVGLGMIAYKLM